jgi:hypothetical protein
MVDFKTAASQNGFSTSKLSLHKLTIIVQKMSKKGFFTLIFYHRAVMKEYHYMTHLLSYHRFEFYDAYSCCKIHRYVLAPFNHLIPLSNIVHIVSFCQFSQLKKRKCTQDALETTTLKIKYCDILLRRYGDADYRVQDLQYCMYD